MELVDTNRTDWRIFGFTVTREIRANLYVPHAGALYSWVCAADVYLLADKLEHRWEQPLSDEEWDAIQWLLDRSRNNLRNGLRNLRRNGRRSWRNRSIRRALPGLLWCCRYVAKSSTNRADTERI